MKIRKQINDRVFLALLVMCTFGGIVFIANAILNTDIIKIEDQYSGGLPVVLLCFIGILVSILVAFMIYVPFKNDKTSTTLVALVLYELAFIFWSTTLFHSRVDRGTSLLAGILFIVATIWLGWICYNLDKNTIYIFIVTLLWSLYVENYTLNVDAHPWN